MIKDFEELQGREKKRKKHRDYEENYSGTFEEYSYEYSYEEKDEKKDVGGAAGLLLGISLTSLFGMLDAIFWIIVGFLVKNRRRFKVRSFFD